MANGGRPGRGFPLIFLLALLPVAGAEAGVEAHLRTVPVPLFFEANVGQAEAGVQFLARGQRLSAIVGSDDIALTFLGAGRSSFDCE